jgi:hypothetical protein
VITQDRRTTKEKLLTLRAVVARDKFLSNSGPCRGGTSWVAWVLTDTMDLNKFEAWVENRGDMVEVRSVDDVDAFTPPADCKHFSIYVVDDEHPGLR